MPETLTLRRLNRATLARQMLLRRETVGVVEAVERLAGLQAQEPKPPFIGLWSRIDGFRRADLHDALHERTLIRATLMRGTLHTVSARDYAAFRATFQPMLTAVLNGILKRRDAQIDVNTVLAVAASHLAEKPRTFTHLRARLLESFPNIDERALGFTVRMRLPLAMHPTTTDRWSFPADAAFTPAEAWLGLPLSPDDARRDLVRRYLAAFGPATVADFQEWSGLQGAKPVFEELRPELVTFRDAANPRREYFDLPEAPRPPEDTLAPPRFLPEWDNLLLAHADRSRVIADEHRARLVTKNGRVRQTFLWDGFVAGFWETERKKGAATLRLLPFAPLSEIAVAALTAEAESLLRFLEDDATTFTVVVTEPGASV